MDQGKKKSFQNPEVTVEELSIALSQSKAELQSTYEKLQKTEQNRRELFANVSHDLRSPLTALKSTVDYMAELEEYDKAEIKRLIKMMQGRIQTLESLVEDSYLLTTLENDEILFQFEVVGIGSFLEEFFYSRLADSKYDKRQLRLDLPQEFEYPVRLDPGRFERVLDNLFTNALKYSFTGDSIVLSAQQAGQEILIGVQDTGIGIPKQALDKIFERAYQVDQSRTPNARRGSGLGLSIVRLILEKHDAQITCESEVGKGSRFLIRLPIAGT